MTTTQRESEKLFNVIKEKLVPETEREHNLVDQACADVLRRFEEAMMSLESLQEILAFIHEDGIFEHIAFLFQTSLDNAWRIFKGSDADPAVRRAKKPDRGKMSDFRSPVLSDEEEVQLQRVFETARIGREDWEELKDAIEFFSVRARMRAMLDPKETAVRDGAV